MHQVEPPPAENGSAPHAPLPSEPSVCRVHPQVALWVVRGVLGTAIGATALALLPANTVQAPLTETVDIFHPTRDETIALPAAISAIPREEVDMAAVPAVVAQPERDHNAEVLSAPERPAAPRARSAPPRRVQAKPFRAPAKSWVHRSAKRPLTALTRGGEAYDASCRRQDCAATVTAGVKSSGAFAQAIKHMMAPTYDT